MSDGIGLASAQSASPLPTHATKRRDVASFERMWILIRGTLQMRGFQSTSSEVRSQPSPELILQSHEVGRTKERRPSLLSQHQSLPLVAGRKLMPPSQKRQYSIAFPRTLLMTWICKVHEIIPIRQLQASARLRWTYSEFRNEE